MKNYVLISIIILSLFSIPTTFSSSLEIIGHNWIYAVAITGSEKIYKGVLINISVTITRGNGDVYISTSPLAEKDMQASAVTAARIACEILGKNFFKYNFYYKIISSAIIVGGPSAGIPLTIVTFSALSGIPVNRSVLATGMINPDGAIGPVGGIPEKSEAAAQFGAKLFLIPYGQSIVTKYVLEKKQVGPFVFTYIKPIKINMTKYALDKWNLKIVEVKNIYEAIEYMTGYKILVNDKKLLFDEDEYPILKSISEEMTDLAKETYHNVLIKINKSQLYYETKKQFINTLKKYSLKPIINIKRSQDIYVSYSLAFESLVNTEWINLVYMYYSHKNLNKEIDNIERFVNETIEKIKYFKYSIGNISELSIIIAATNYALLSLKNLNEAKTLWSKNIYDSLYYASLAKWNAYISRLWIKHISNKEKRYVFPSLKRIVETYLAEAKSTLSYTSTLLEETGGTSSNIKNAIFSYELSKDFYEKNEYMYSLVESIRCLTYAETSFDSWITNTGTNPGYLISHARSMAIISMNKLANFTIPLFSLLLFKIAENSTKFNEKILYYKLSSYYSKLIHDILSYSNLNVTKSKIHYQKNITKQNNTRINQYLSAISFIVTLFFILVFMLAVLYIIRKRYSS